MASPYHRALPLRTTKMRVGDQPIRPLSVLLAGGEQFSHDSGQALRVIQEFDVSRGVFYCHRELPHPVYGGVAGVHNGKLHLVGGGDWWFISGTRRVQVFDVASAPVPEPCAYQYTQQSSSIFERSSDRFHPYKSWPYPPMDQADRRNAFERRVVKSLRDHVRSGCADRVNKNRSALPPHALKLYTS